ncbi:MAG TPA: hypothetical protein VNJ08_11795 [Bacteriovoracaceae bacterium]|nr:hypothetical protein [Bacteriovoracaceae bacterium]
MLRTVSLLFVFLSLTSCGGSGGGSSDGAPAASSASTTKSTAESLKSLMGEEISIEAPVPTAALNFEVDVDLHNFDSRQEDKVLEAADLIKRVVASEEFKNRILNHKVKGRRVFYDNEGLTNAQIYKRILSGSESLSPGSDNKMNLELEVFQDSTNTVGFTYPDTHRIWMNKKYLNKNEAWKVTTNMMHEWLHKLGFKHDRSETPMRKYSVPYAIGYLVAELAKKEFL